MYKCTVCQKRADYNCEDCQSSYYCGVDCQTADWQSTHSKICQKLIGRGVNPEARSPGFVTSAEARPEPTEKNDRFTKGKGVHNRLLVGFGETFELDRFFQPVYPSQWSFTSNDGLNLVKKIDLPNSRPSLPGNGHEISVFFKATKEGLHTVTAVNQMGGKVLEKRKYEVLVGEDLAAKYAFDLSTLKDV